LKVTALETKYNNKGICKQMSGFDEGYGEERGLLFDQKKLNKTIKIMLLLLKYNSFHNRFSLTVSLPKNVTA